MKAEKPKRSKHLLELLQEKEENFISVVEKIQQLCSDVTSVESKHPTFLYKPSIKMKHKSMSFWILKFELFLFVVFFTFIKPLVED